MRKPAVLHDGACSGPPQLPAELWEYIFLHLSIKDWARAAAACRAFWAVQPYRAGMCCICLDRAYSPGMRDGAASKSPMLLSALHATGPSCLFVCRVSRRIVCKPWSLPTQTS